LVKSHAPEINNYIVQKLRISQAWQTALHVEAVLECALASAHYISQGIYCMIS